MTYIGYVLAFGTGLVLGAWFNFILDEMIDYFFNEDLETGE